MRPFSPLPNFSEHHVLVIGDVMLDRYWHGNTDRISPEAPVPVVHVQSEDDRAGGAANVAINLATLGCATHLISAIGEDEAGQRLRAILMAAKIDCALAEYTMTTSTKLRILSQHQQLIRLDFEEPKIQLPFNLLEAAFLDNLKHQPLIVLSDYNKGILKHAPHFISEAKKHGCPILVDPKGKDFSLYRGATLLTPNRKEFELVVGPCETEQEILEKGKQLIADYALDALLITRGAQGMTLIEAQQESPLHLPAEQRDVFDVTGAGDTVIATLAAALASGERLQDAARLANLAAGISVSKLGATAVTPEELDRARLPHYLLEPSVLNEAQLLDTLKNARARGERIVMTNGCFDILHAGHVRYLNQAKSLGDRLIVAVNDDASVQRLKGKDRPINSLSTRMTILSALSSVDWVVSFSEDTPSRLIQTILPDVLVKGGDYPDPLLIPGAKEVIENGGEMKLLHFEENSSTTNIINKIKKGE